jgi:hypothetical protein
MRLRHIIGLGLVFAALAQAAVTRVEIVERADLPMAGFERISGKLHFALDPKLAASKQIVDLHLAPKNGQGLVEFSSDFLVFRPKDVAKSNGTALLEIVNRGRSQMWTMLNSGANANMRSLQDFGDNFLLNHGYTVILVGWQWDIAERPGNFKVYAPVVPNVTGPVRIEIIPNAKQIADSLPYPLANANSGTLTVRDAPYGPRTVIAKSQWRYSADQKQVEYPSGFAPGRIYEFVYTAKEPVVGGTGMAAVRDYISYVKKNGVVPGLAVNEVKRAVAFGNSQSGRLLRTFLYEGFNADEQGKQVFEGVWAQVAGAGHGGFNQRFVQPGRTTGQYTGSFYPTDQSPFNPGALLAKANAAGVAPKLFLMSGSHEYWGRAASLNHIAEDGSKDLEPPANVRIYFVAGTQHGGGGGGPNPTTQNLTNSMEWTYILRATMVNLNAWVTSNTLPPASVFPRMDKNQLVPISALNFPQIPGFAIVNYAYAPRRLDFGPEYATKGIVAYEPPHAGGQYPVLVPTVDGDGNETSGIRLPELIFPLATHTGWNLRHPTVGAPDQQYSLIGSQIAFARTKADREKTGDPRLSISERYRSRAEYLTHIETAARALAGQHFLLEADLPRVVALAGRHYDAIMNPSPTK